MSKKAIPTAQKFMPKVRVEATGKNLTTLAGLHPVMRFLRKIGFKQQFSESLTHKRGHTAQYHLVDAVQLTSLALIAGARSLDEVERVWSDRVLRKIGGWDKVMDATTMGRIFKGLDDSHMDQLETLNHKLRQRAWKLARVQTDGLSTGDIWVDVDSTVKTTYGTKQEGAEVGYNAHKRGARSYHPQLAFCAKTKELLQAELRPGNEHSAKGIVAFMEKLVPHLPKASRMVFRADSGYFGGALLEWLEGNNSGYLVKARMRGMTDMLSQREDWKAVAGHAGWQETVFEYECANWSKKRRFVALRQEIKENESVKTEEKESIQTEDDKQGAQTEGDKKSVQDALIDVPAYDYFCYVTTEVMTAWETHKTYGKRATCETWIDESKNQMALAHIKSSSFKAASAMFQCSVMAYNTVRWMALASNDKQLIRWEIASVRSFIIRMAGRLISSARTLTMQTPPEHLHMEQWNHWLAVGCCD